MNEKSTTMKKRYLSVDSGKFATKAVMENVRSDGSIDISSVIFPTTCDEVSDYNRGMRDMMTLNSNYHLVEFNGHQYRVGDTEGCDSFEDSKDHPIHRICTYTAIAQLVDNDDIVYLAIGCPLSVYNNVEAVEDYVNHMKGNGKITITVDGVQKTFVIISVNAYPESSGIIYKEFPKYSKKTIGIIDIGGLNTNCCVYDHGRPVKSSIFTTRLGGKRMLKDLDKILNDKLQPNVHFEPFIIRNAINDGFIKNRSNPEKEKLSRQIINDYRRKHIQEIKNSCISYNWDLDSIELAFVGGTSLLLKDEIKDIFNVGEECFFEDAQLLNAQGWLETLV